MTAYKIGAQATDVLEAAARGGALCRACATSVESKPVEGAIRPFLDWRSRDEHLCQHPPWYSCAFFTEAFIAYVKSCAPEAGTP